MKTFLFEILLKILLDVFIHSFAEIPNSLKEPKSIFRLSKYVLNYSNVSFSKVGNLPTVIQDSKSYFFLFQGESVSNVA